MPHNSPANSVFATMNQAGKEEYFIRTLEEDAMEVECLLVEPETGNASVDGVFFCPKDNLKCTEIVHIPYKFGGQDTNAAGRREGTSEYKAGKEEYFIRALEEDAMEVECLLVEPETGNASVDGVFFCPKDNLKCTEIVHIPYKFGGQDTNAAGRREGTSEYKVLDVLPDKVGAEDSQAANGLSNACEDYLLDGFPESFAYLDYGFNDGLHLACSGLASQNPGFTSSNIVNFGASTKLTENVVFSGCENNILDKTSLHCSFSIKLEPETLDETKSLDFSTSDKNEKDTSPPDFTSDELSSSSRSVENNETKSVCGSEEIDKGHGWDNLSKTSTQEGNIGSFLKQKRSRKPTRRYIDESSNHSSRRLKRQEIPRSGSKDKNLGVRCLKQRRNMGSKGKILPADELFGEAIQVPFDSQAIQVPFDYEAPKESPKTQTAIPSPAQKGNSSKELSPAELSEDEPEARVRSYGGSAQRKLHKLWSISEVRKLIDGVSCCGVGKWTEIKKLLFSSSVHRTPVDLKDKWRNLLKAASCPVNRSKREDERKRNQPWRPLPKSVLCRVRELAMVHPYPREAKSKISKSNHSHVHHLPSPDLPARTQGIRI